MVKHGNWNAHQKTDEELREEAVARTRTRVGRVMRVAEEMFTILESSELSNDQRACAVEIIGSMFRKLDDNK